jgi:hypothetical protein
VDQVELETLQEIMVRTLLPLELLLQVVEAVQLMVVTVFLEVQAEVLEDVVLVGQQTLEEHPPQ